MQEASSETGSRCGLGDCATPDRGIVVIRYALAGTFSSRDFSSFGAFGPITRTLLLDENSSLVGKLETQPCLLCLSPLIILSGAKGISDIQGSSNFRRHNQRSSDRHK